MHFSVQVNQSATVFDGESVEVPSSGTKNVDSRMHDQAVSVGRATGACFTSSIIDAVWVETSGVSGNNVGVSCVLGF